MIRALAVILALSATPAAASHMPDNWRDIIIERLRAQRPTLERVEFGITVHNPNNDAMCARLPDGVAYNFLFVRGRLVFVVPAEMSECTEIAEGVTIRR